MLAHAPKGRPETVGGVHRLHGGGRHGVGFMSLACSGAALPGHALTGKNCQGTVLCIAVFFGVLPWHIHHWYWLHALLPSPEGKCLPSVLLFAYCLLADWRSTHVSQEGVCAAWGCAKGLDGAWAFIEATSFIRGLPPAVLGLQTGLSSNKRCISVPLGILQLFPLPLSCGRGMPFLSCSGCQHTDVFSYLVGLVCVFSLVEKGTFFVYVAGVSSDDCDL